jgi:hypothetical protein
MIQNLGHRLEKENFVVVQDATEAVSQFSFMFLPSSYLLRPSPIFCLKICVQFLIMTVMCIMYVNYHPPTIRADFLQDSILSTDQQSELDQ